MKQITIHIEDDALERLARVIRAHEKTGYDAGALFELAKSIAVNCDTYDVLYITNTSDTDHDTDFIILPYVEEP